MTNYRIEISPLPKWRDARGEGVKHQINSFLGLNVDAVRSRDVYTFSADITDDEARRIAATVCNPVLQGWRVGGAKSENFLPLPPCDYLVVVGFRPGVTDNVARTLRDAAADVIGRTLREEVEWNGMLSFPRK